MDSGRRLPQVDRVQAAAEHKLHRTGDGPAPKVSNACHLPGPLPATGAESGGPRQRRYVRDCAPFEGGRRTNL